MYSGSEKLAGHAYAPGFEPGTLAAFVQRMGESDLWPMAVAALGCCILAAVLAPTGLGTSLGRRKKRREQERRELSAEELSARLRKQGVIR